MLRTCTRIAPTTTNSLCSVLQTLPTRQFSSIFRSSSTKHVLRPLVSTRMTGQYGLKVMARTSVVTTTVIGGPLLVKRPTVACEAQQVPSPAEVIQTDTGKNTIVHKGEITFGTVLGVCTGYFIKKLGKLFAFMVGLGFVCLQYLSARGFVTVHWDRIAGRYNRGFDVDQDGRVTTRDIHRKWQTFVGLLTHNLQFKSTFLAGLYAGIRYG